MRSIPTMHNPIHSIRLCLVAMAALLCAPQLSQAQENSQGFTQIAPSLASGEERNRQPDLWVMEVQFRSLRMIWSEVADSKTGEMKSEPFLYLPYRAYMRPLEKPAAEDTTPRNTLDPRPQPPMIVPTFWLVPKDGKSSSPILDTVLPSVQQKILVRERLPLKNSVDIVSPVPAASQAGDPTAETIEGVALFRNVDLSIDRFTLRASGFSNGYQKVESPDGSPAPLLLRKSIEFEIWRPGDKFDATENEFRFVTKPAWVYIPDPKVD